MAGQPKTIVIIKRAPILAPAVQPGTRRHTAHAPHIVTVRPITPVIEWRPRKQWALGAMRGFSRFGWESAPAACFAVVSGIAAAYLATTLVIGTTRLHDSSLPPAVSTQTPEPPTSLEHDLPASGPSSMPAAVRESPPAEDGQVTTVTQRPARTRTVRPKFPDAFQGEVRIHEEAVAQPKTRDQLKDISGLGAPLDGFSSPSERRPLPDGVNEPAIRQTYDTAPSVMESMSEPSRRSVGSD